MATATACRGPHTEFRDVTAHTAKCDVCNQKNKQILKRCLTCSWGICTPCSRDRGDNLTHGAASGASYSRPTPIPKPPTPAPKAEDIETFDLTSETSQSTQASATTRGKGKSRATASSTKAAATQHKRKARTIIDSGDEDGPSETYIPRPTKSGRTLFSMPPPTSPNPSPPGSPAGPATPRRTSTRRKTAETTRKSAMKRAAEKSTQGEASSSATTSQAASRHERAMPGPVLARPPSDADQFRRNVTSLYGLARTDRLSGAERRHRVVTIAQGLIDRQNQDGHGQEGASTGTSTGSSYPALTDGLMTLGLAAAHQEGYRQRQLIQGSATLRHEPRRLSPREASTVAEHKAPSASAAFGDARASEHTSKEASLLQYDFRRAQQQPEPDTYEPPQRTETTTPQEEAVAQAVVRSIFIARMSLSNIEFHATMTAASDAVKRADEERYWAEINPLRGLLHASSQLASGELSLAPSTPNLVLPRPPRGSEPVPASELLEPSHSVIEVPQRQTFQVPQAPDRASPRAIEQPINIAPSGSFFKAVNEGPRDSDFALSLIPLTVRQQNHHQEPTQAVAGPSTQRSSSKRSLSIGDQESTLKPKRHRHEASRDDLTQIQRSRPRSEGSDLSSIDTEPVDTPSRT